MYIPPSFEVTDTDQLHDFIDRHSFATLISQDANPDGNQTLVSHLPLLLDRLGEGVSEEEGRYGRLFGHMARENSQWQCAEGQLVVAVFHGPHAYISPAWYDAINVVPTWNYVAVHAHGTMRLQEDPERVLQILQRTVDTYEGGSAQPWSLDRNQAGFVDGLLKSIVGFEIEISRLEGNWKLSQNHDVSRRHKAIHALRERGAGSCEIADLMESMLEG